MSLLCDPSSLVDHINNTLASHMLIELAFSFLLLDVSMVVDGRGGALLIPVTSSSNQQLYQYRTFQSMSHNPITSPQARLNVAPMIIGADDESEPRNEIPVNSQQIRTLTEDELQICKLTCYVAVQLVCFQGLHPNFR